LNDLKLDPLEVTGLINLACYGEFADHFQDQRGHQDRRRHRRVRHA